MFLQTCAFSHPVSVCVCSEIGDENKGRQMLEKMGWKRGEGLGKDGAGIKDPVILISPRFVYAVSRTLACEINAYFPLCVHAVDSAECPQGSVRSWFWSCRVDRRRFAHQNQKPAQLGTCAGTVLWCLPD